MERVSIISTNAASSTLAGEEAGPVRYAPPMPLGHKRSLTENIFSHSKFEAALAAVSRRASQHEHQIADLEVSSPCRAVHLRLPV